MHRKGYDEKGSSTKVTAIKDAMRTLLIVETKKDTNFWITTTHDLTSVQVIFALIGDNDIHYQVLKYMQFTLGSIPIVHIEDVSNAHIFLMEHPSAQGRHICSVDSATIKSLKDLLSKQLKTSLKLYEEDSINRYVPFSSKKLLDMGFSYKYSLEHTFEEGIECCKKNKILN
ncbi:putative anthocyanidin reductase [Cryptomeria japonica]|uniref:putative anthocyanidin reductase n=1 Tax=Cryptomeria japonica TaxID=3369 RepID=UPI0027DA7578|nr:putative anthocyanidin reductase [Cryptomeria japonica]